MLEREKSAISSEPKQSLRRFRSAQVAKNQAMSPTSEPSTMTFVIGHAGQSLPYAFSQSLWSISLRFPPAKDIEICTAPNPMKPFWLGGTTPRQMRFPPVGKNDVHLGVINALDGFLWVDI